MAAVPVAEPSRQRPQRVTAVGRSSQQYSSAWRRGGSRLVAMRRAGAFSTTTIRIRIHA
ncbi:hypothetical protein ACLB1S_10370 [Escherichia coli]